MGTAYVGISLVLRTLDLQQYSYLQSTPRNAFTTLQGAGGQGPLLPFYAPILHRMHFYRLKPKVAHFYPTFTLRLDPIRIPPPVGGAESDV